MKNMIPWILLSESYNGNSVCLRINSVNIKKYQHYGRCRYKHTRWFEYERAGGQGKLHGHGEVELWPLASPARVGFKRSYNVRLHGQSGSLAYFIWWIQLTSEGWDRAWHHGHVGMIPQLKCMSRSQSLGRLTGSTDRKSTHKTRRLDHTRHIRINRNHTNRSNNTTT
jgi:hypothetical protein